MSGGGVADTKYLYPARWGWIKYKMQDTVQVYTEVFLFQLFLLYYYLTNLYYYLTVWSEWSACSMGQKMCGVKQMSGQRFSGVKYCQLSKNVGVQKWWVNFLVGADTEWSACAMGKRGPPVAYAIFEDLRIQIMNLFRSITKLSPFEDFRGLNLQFFLMSYDFSNCNN